MRDYTWQMFEVTGDIEAYLLYRAWDLHAQDSEVNAAEDFRLEDDVPNPPQ